MHLMCMHHSWSQHVCCYSMLYCVFMENIIPPVCSANVLQQTPFLFQAEFYLSNHVCPCSCNKQAGHLISGLFFILQRWSFQRGLDKGWRQSVASLESHCSSQQCNPSMHSFQRMPNSLLKMSCRPDSIRSPLCLYLSKTHTFHCSWKRHTHTLACHQLH